MKTMQSRTPGWIAALALLTVTATQAQTIADTLQEREAIEVVKKWWEAWKTADPDKITAMVSDDIVFQGIPTDPIEKGRGAFHQHVARISPAKSISVPEAVAMGGTTGTVVLTKRLLTLSMGGKEVTTPFAALTIVKDGKIAQWQDFPLTRLEGSPGGPPSGDSSPEAKRNPGSDSAASH